MLQQFLNSPTIFPRFALDCEPRMDAVLLYNLRSFVGIEDALVFDNSLVLEEQRKKRQ